TNAMRATINVTNAGPHTLTVWMREDGFVLDKLLLTVNPSYQPMELGPQESPTQPPAPTNQPPGRRIPSLTELLAATQYLHPGDTLGPITQWTSTAFTASKLEDRTPT